MLIYLPAFAATPRPPRLFIKHLLKDCSFIHDEPQVRLQPEALLLQAVHLLLGHILPSLNKAKQISIVFQNKNLN